jgi:hypothetical protein
MNPPRPRRSLGTVGIGPLGMLWCVLVGHCSPAAAHEIPIEFWAVSLMPLCQKHVDGFATKAEVPYSKWRSKHREALRELGEPQAPASEGTSIAGSDSLRNDCEDLLNYLADDLRPPDARFATPQGTWGAFLKASRSGDRATVAECFAGIARAKNMRRLDPLTPDQLAAIAGSFSELRAAQPIGDNLQEGWVNRGEQAGVVQFIRTSRGWQMLELP